MKTGRILRGLIAVGAVGAMLSHPVDVAARARSYDLSIFLYQVHPFATAPNFRAAGNAPIPRIRTRQPMRMPVTTGTTPQTRPAASRVLPSYRAAGLMADAGQQSRPRFLSEVRFGLLVHDEGPFSRNEEDGVDANFEVLFNPPEFLKKIWSPRPHVGASINSSGDTSQFYLGLTWEWEFRQVWYVDFSLGGAAHTGKKKTNDIKRKELGCKVLFRESIELGYRIRTRHSISAFLDHLSNGNICDKNEGLESIGMRYGYRF
jgi:lipid A 3-O-deacylase